jgi:Spy/CpxP family protein refolding chaperone
MIRNPAERRIVTGGAAAALLAAAIVGGSTALARSTHDGGIGGGAFFGEPRVLRALDLTGQQTRAVHAVLLAHGSSLHRLAADERVAKRAIGDKLVAPGPLTEGDVDGLLDQEVQARAALARERLATAIAVRDQLTPAQIAEVASIRDGVAETRVHMRPLRAERAPE